MHHFKNWEEKTPPNPESNNQKKLAKWKEEKRNPELKQKNREERFINKAIKAGYRKHKQNSC